MLIHNGFVIENNRHNSLVLKIGVAVKDPLFNERSALLDEFGLNAYGFILLLLFLDFILNNNIIFIKELNRSRSRN